MYQGHTVAEMYENFSKEDEKKLSELGGESTDIPSLVIVSTMDMELAHIDGYKGTFMVPPRGAAFEVWKTQISNTEEAVKSNPLRLFPLFCYDPRRYRYDKDLHTERDMIKNCGYWDEPFARIVGVEHKTRNVKDTSRIWIGFKLYPSLGFRPSDRSCIHLWKFYKECQTSEENGKPVPILVHCAREGVITHDAALYMSYDQKISDDENETANTDKMNYFYDNYGHPGNWRRVLELNKDLRLCLAGFGGNSEWKKEWEKSEWIKIIIDLMKKHNNVYADISGLNIYDPAVKSNLEKILKSQSVLKYKLIFGSGWYHSCLSDAIKSVDNKGYDNYCTNVRRLIYDIDKTGELWERISLVNPWKFYALSKEKIDILYDNLKKVVRSSGKSGKMLENMHKKVFNEEFIEYIDSKETYDVKLDSLTVSVKFEQGAKKSDVSQHTIDIIARIAKDVGMDIVVVTSTIRSLDDQINAMYRNIQKTSLEHQRGVYGSKGRNVLAAYSQALEDGKSISEIKEAMAQKAIEVGFASTHIIDNYHNVNAVDIGQNTNFLNKENLRKNFIERAQQECGVRVIIEETCVHLDITQPKK